MTEICLMRDNNHCYRHSGNLFLRKDFEMKTILFPTDFSDLSYKTVKYLNDFIAIHPAKIILLHIVQYLITSVYMDSETIFTEAEKAAKEKMTDFTNYVQTNLNFDSVTSILQSMDKNDSIGDIATKKHADWIVMSLHHEAGVLLGSTVRTTLIHSAVPVLVIPERCIYKKVEKIIFAIDYNSNDFENLQEIVDWAKNWNSQIVVAHITNKDMKLVTQKLLQKWFQEDVLDKLNYSNISYKVCDTGSFESTLTNLIQDQKADWVVVNMRNRKWIDRVREKSHTLKLLRNLHQPMLVFHVNEEV